MKPDLLKLIGDKELKDAWHYLSKQNVTEPTGYDLCVLGPRFSFDVMFHEIKKSWSLNVDMTPVFEADTRKECVDHIKNVVDFR